jgi:hypothetical protein
MMPGSCLSGLRAARCRRPIAGDAYLNRVYYSFFPPALKGPGDIVGKSETDTAFAAATVHLLHASTTNVPLLQRMRPAMRRAKQFPPQKLRRKKSRNDSF